MSITKRQESILALLDEHGYMTVERLSSLTYTSPSSIRRDLTHLENLSLVKRTHGGASSHTEVGQVVPFSSRMAKNVAEKRRIARAASELITDGMTVMLDGSTTAGFLIPYIAKHRDITLFTNNMLTAINGVNHGILTHCIGGVAIGGSAVLSGERAYAEVERINPDILFFSSRGLDRDGNISDPVPEEHHLRELMLRNARFSVFLCDSGKFGTKSLYTLTNLDKINACVFDKPWAELKTECKVIY